MQGSTTYDAGSVTTRTDGGGSALNMDALRDLIKLKLAQSAQPQPVMAQGASLGEAPRRPAQPFVQDHSGAQLAAQMRASGAAERPIVNMAPLEDMDVKAGDLQKTGAQRVTDRSNMKRTMLGIPSGDVTQGPHNPGHESRLEGPPRVENVPFADTAAGRTVAARYAAGWNDQPTDYLTQIAARHAGARA